MLTVAAFLIALSAAPVVGDPPEVAAALARWHKGYVAGEVELAQPAAEGKKSPIYKRLLGERGITLTHRQGLSQLFAMAIEAQSVELSHVMLRLAAVDRDGVRIDPRRRPDVVRSAAISSLGRFDDMRAVYAIIQVSSGKPEEWRGAWHEGHQAAAVRALGAIDKAVTRPTIERACRSPVAVVRLAAAAALHAMGPPRSLGSICDAMATETDSRVAEQLARTARAILQRHVDQCDTTLVRRAVHTAIDMFGRTDWRADLAVVELCGQFRNRAAIDPLIRTLERFHQSPEEVDSGKLSGILRHHAHEVLESLTGARIPADQPEQWRAFWDRVGPTFVLAKEPEKTQGQTRAGFFGIPIRGSRIVFVIDRSGSMKARHAAHTDDGDAELLTRYQVARAELLRAAAALPADTKFNVITFAQDVRQWRHQFSDPSDSSIRALRSRLHKRKPDGGTNLYGALAKTLDIRLAQFGERYDTPVDEIFLLSDGAPSVGEVINPDEIRSIIREVNTHRKVRINTIFIGPATESAFMSALAADNDGHFVRL